jgi:hypothetical protein
MAALFVLGDTWGYTTGVPLRRKLVQVSLSRRMPSFCASAGNPASFTAPSLVTAGRVSVSAPVFSGNYLSDRAVEK